MKSINFLRLTTVSKDGQNRCFESRSYEDAEEFISNNSITKIKIDVQNGPIGEKGLNGLQVDDLIKISKCILEKLNRRFACRENSFAIAKLDEAVLWLGKRTEDRIKRGVEGKNKE